MKIKVFSLVMMMLLIISCFGVTTIATNVVPTDLSTNIAFVTDDNNETEFINDIDKKIKDEEYLSKQNINKNIFNNVNTKKIEKKMTTDSKRFLSKDNFSADAETICINYEILRKNNSGIEERIKELVNNGSLILFYGKNINFKQFCKTFGLEKNIPKEMPDKQSQIQKDQDTTVCIGVEKSEWGYSLVQTFSSEYNFYRVVNGLFASAEHAKKIKVKKPYNDFYANKNLIKSENPIEAFSNLLTSTASAAGIDDYPIINSVRYQSDFGNYDANWHLITDCYMHRVADQDPQRDYFVFETISEMDPEYDASQASYSYADQFYTKLRPSYTNDIVRAGGPADQGGTTSVTVNLYPPSISFTYSPGSKISVDSTLSLQDKYFEAYYNDESFWGAGFEDSTIFRTELSYSANAPDSNHTYVGVNIYQKARNDSHNDQYPWAFNGKLYYYDY